ncbi:MAG TPA: helicase-related protein, partial [Candidatus Didemnitutus sp.]|nr:helicase-related protein [Candidatus Didemnitutus sp.]
DFKNLGLLIIDEEHRFGVAAKEKLRQLRSSVDTLTLTATPIPRTLNFSLMGARDLSVIETPPRNRLPIRTEILQWTDEVLREALLRELERGGQAFIVTDRINDMDKLMMKVKMLVPTLRIAMAHGQMESDHLEDVMEGFLERKFDVLIATKIIESGLDIPNANTMIIEHADNFGLAELYQLRGRVGRSNTQAYCFLLIPPPHTLSRTALRRLQALEEYTDLGSGFQLAMRDLEIRGAGNLLGGEQSGFIMDMGFELYQKILDEAVTELRHEEFSQLFAGTKALTDDFTNEDIAVELDADALLPKAYIPGDTDRYDVYKRLYNAHEQREVDLVFNELRDRFGTLPPEAEELLFAVRLRIAALPSGFLRVNVKEGRLLAELPADSDTRWYGQVFKQILPLLTSIPNARFVQNGKRLLIEVLLGRREEAIGILEQFSSLAAPREEPTEELL